MIMIKVNMTLKVGCTLLDLFIHSNVNHLLTKESKHTMSPLEEKEPLRRTI